MNPLFIFSTPLDDSVDRVIHESVALNRSHDSLVNGGPDGYGHDESGAESDEAFSDWDSCEELVLVCHLYKYIYTAKKAANLLQVVSFTVLLKLQNKLRQIFQFHQLATTQVVEIRFVSFKTFEEL